MLKRLSSWKAKKERDRIKNHDSELRKIELRKKNTKAKIRKKERTKKRNEELRIAKEELKQLEVNLKSGDNNAKKEMGGLGKTIITGIKKEVGSLVEHYSKPPSKRGKRRR